MRSFVAALVLFSVALVAGASGMEEEGTIVYDQNGFPVELIDADGTTIVLVNDGNGSFVRVLDEFGNVLLELTEE